MTVVLPISHVDASLAVKLADWMQELDSGSYPDRTVIVYLSPKAEPVFGEISQQLSKVFGTVVKRVQQSSMDPGWPVSPNIIFQEVAFFISNDPQLSSEPWYFFEPDNTPTRKGWLREFEEEYARAGKPFMGYSQPTIVFNNDTKEFSESSPHMVGTGIYPGRFAANSTLIKFVHATHHPFDTFLSGEVMGGGLHPANNLILHNWGSCNYRVSNGEILCENDFGCAGWAVFHERGNWTKEDTKSLTKQFAAPYRGQAAVVHGCKDGTCIDALRALSKPSRKTKPKTP